MYYLLKQVDNNGELKYSRVFAVHMLLNNLFSIFQTAAASRLSVQLYQAVQHATMQVIDASGCVQFQQRISQSAAIGYYGISKLSPGSYFAKIIDNNQTHLARLEIIKLISINCETVV